MIYWWSIHSLANLQRRSLLAGHTKHSSGLAF